MKIICYFETLLDTNCVIPDEEERSCLAWICENCGEGNITDSIRCIKCNTKKPMEYHQNCWELLQCNNKNMQDCVVYNTKMGRECWKFHNVLRGCSGNNDQLCPTCGWYKKIMN